MCINSFNPCNIPKVVTLSLQGRKWKLRKVKRWVYGQLVGEWVWIHYTLIFIVLCTDATHHPLLISATMDQDYTICLGASQVLVGCLGKFQARLLYTYTGNPRKSLSRFSLDPIIFTLTNPYSPAFVAYTQCPWHRQVVGRGRGLSN